MLRGGPTEGYIKMPSYLYMLDTVYPNSYIRIHKSKNNEFMYLFIALYIFIKGLEHCRPIFVVDGAHLKGAYKGTFVSASLSGWSRCVNFIERMNILYVYLSFIILITNI